MELPQTLLVTIMQKEIDLYFETEVEIKRVKEGRQGARMK